MKKVHLSVVIPAYKETDNIRAGALQSVYSYLREQKYEWEVIIVDDGSPDNTADMAETFANKHKGFLVMREPHRGKGGTVIAGVLAANGKYVLFADMDQATPIGEVEKLLSKLEGGYDVAIGSRSGRKGAPLLRKVMAYGFMILRATILRLPYSDTQCGFKALSREAAREVFTRMKVVSKKTSMSAGVTAGFDLEILYLARKLGLKVAEVPVEWEHKGSARVSPLRDSWQGLRDLIKVRINAIKGTYRI